MHDWGLFVFFVQGLMLLGFYSAYIETSAGLAQAVCSGDDSSLGLLFNSGWLG